MRNGCIPDLGNTFLWKRKSKSKIDERTSAKAKEVSKLMIEECLIRGDVECKSHVHDSSTSVKNGTSRRKEVTHGEPRDKLVYKSIVHNSSAANKNRILRETEVITAETKEMAGEKLDDIIALDESLDTQKYEEAKDKLMEEFNNLFKNGVLQSKFNSDETRGALNDEFHKVKTFDLRGIKSSVKRLKSFIWS